MQPRPGPSQEVVAFLEAERRQRWANKPRERGGRVEQEARVAHAFAHAPRVAIDFSFASTLNDVERRSLWRQLQVCYGANRRAAAPLSLHFTSLAGCPPEAFELGWPSERPRPSSAVELVRALGWTVGVHEGAVTEHFDPSSVVYLSPDADAVLDTRPRTRTRTLTPPLPLPHTPPPDPDPSPDPGCRPARSTCWAG